MRVKSLVAAVGVAVVAAVVVVPGVSNASRGGGTAEPVVQPSVEGPVDEEPPAEPAAEEVPAEPAPQETPAEEAPAEEAPAEPVDEETPVEPPAPKPEPVEEETPVVEVVEDPPAVEEPPVVTPEPQVVPAPDRGEGPAEPDRTRETGPCHMDSYEPVQVDGLDNAGESARAQKVDRNDNGTVCRKDIPGRGRGNTGQGSNIKDDQVR